MTNDVKTKKEPELGLIVVGRIPVKMLSQPVYPEFLYRRGVGLNRIPTYADGLFLLAKHGFRVEVPAMVAYTGGDTLPDGASLRERMHTAGTHKADLISAHAAPHAFLRRIGNRSEGGDISIGMPAEGNQTPWAKFIRDLVRAAGIKDHATRADAIKLVQKDYRVGFQDRAPEDVIRELPEGYSKPVILLSDKAGVTDELRRQRPDLTIVSLTTRGYIDSMRQSELFSRMGITITPHLNESQLADRIWADVQRMWGDDREYDPHRVDTSRTIREEQDNYFENMLGKVKEKLNAPVPPVQGPFELKADEGTGLAKRLAEMNAARERRFGRRPTDGAVPESGQLGK